MSGDKSDNRPVVIVTGAGRGLGKGIAKQLAEDGFNVAIVDLDRTQAKAAASEIEVLHRGLDAELAGFGADITQHLEVEQLIGDVVARWGRIDGLVNNAGVIARGRAETFSHAIWQQHLDVHLTGAMLCSQAAFPHLRHSNQASVVNIGSVGSSFGLPGRVAYTTAKTGVIGLTRVLAAEWGPYGITVNAVAPGYMDTTMTHSGFETGVIDEDRLLTRIPLAKLGQASDIGFAVSFLVSQRARYITGATLKVDGGITIDGTFGPPE